MKDFVCEQCGFCCQLNVKLKSEDVKILEKSNAKGFSREKNGKLFLAKKSNHCKFLKNNICIIYEFRPYECRRFPFNKDGSMSEKCKQRDEFNSKVVQNIIMFMNEEK